MFKRLLLVAALVISAVCASDLHAAQGMEDGQHQIIVPAAQLTNTCDAELRAMMLSPVPWVRNEAGNALVARCKVGAVPMLAEMLRDPDWHARRAASDAALVLLQSAAELYPESDPSNAADMVAQSCTNLIPALVDNLTNSRHWVRHGVAAVLGRLGPRAGHAAAALAAAAFIGVDRGDHRSATPRIMRSLQEVGAPEELLLHVAQQGIVDAHGTTRSSAVGILENLSRASQRAAVPDLLTALRTLPDPIYTIWDVQGRIARLLAQQGVTNAIPILIAHLELTDWGVNHRYRCYAPVLALYGQGACAALPVLEKGLTMELDDDHQKIIKDAIARIKAEPMPTPGTEPKEARTPGATTKAPPRRVQQKPVQVQHDEELTLLNLGEYETPFRLPSDMLNWNLGPLGARGWVRGHKGFGGDVGRELLVISVATGSPAHAILKPYDVITGANGTRFDGDARRCLGEAIGWAEAHGGTLQLDVLRDAATHRVTITLDAVGAYTPRAPFECPKSRRILDRATQHLATTMHPAGFQYHGDAQDVYDILNALLLLASDKPEYLDHVRRTVRSYVDTPAPGTGAVTTWGDGYRAMLLAEYYLATGDASVLDALKQYCDWIAMGQSTLGGWGHGIPIAAYGHVNSVGLVCAIGMELSRECGVSIDREVLGKAISFFSHFEGAGIVNYGNDEPDLSLTTGYGDNGKSGTAAVFFDLIGRAQAARESGMVTAALHAQAESGHTGNFWSYLWGPIGARLAGMDYYAIYQKQLQWYHDLARTWDDGFIVQPWVTLYEGQQGMGCYVGRGTRSTGGLCLYNAMPLRSLRILGAPAGIFSVKLPTDLAAARALHSAGKFRECSNMIAGLDYKAGSAEAELAASLLARSRHVSRSVELTLDRVDGDILSGDLYTASCRMAGLRPLLHDYTARVAAINTHLAAPAATNIITAGRQYYGLLGMQATGVENMEFVQGISADREKRAQMVALSNARGAGAYQALAREALAAHPFHNETTVPLLTRDEATCTNSASSSFAFTIDKPERFSGLQLKLKAAGTLSNLTVSLNSRRVARLVPKHEARGEVSLRLKPRTLEILERGTNTICITTDQDTPVTTGIELVGFIPASFGESPAL